MKKLIYTLLIAGATLSANSQQVFSADHFQVQQYMVNPAAAGMNGSNLFLDYRKQWAGFVGAPETQIFCVDGSVNHDKIGLGLTAVNDQVNILGSTNVLSTFAYRVKYGENHFLRFGLSAGLNNNRIIFDRVVAKDPSELQLFSNNQNATSFDAAGGLLYQYRSFIFGISASNLFQQDFYYENNFSANNLNFQNIRHYMLNAQYRFDLNKGKWGIMPSAQMMTAQGVKSLFGGGVTGFYKKDVWLKLGYAHKVGYSVGLGGVLGNVIIGYAYTHSTNLVGYNQGTHDVILGLRLGGSSKQGGGYGDLKEIEDLKNKNNELYETTDILKNKNEELKKEVEQNKKDILDLKKQLSEMNVNSGLSEEDRLMLLKLKSEFEVDAKELDKMNKNNEKDNSVSNATFSSYDYCVIVGAYTDMENAKIGQQILKQQFGLETTIIGKENGKYLFLCSDFFESPKEVKAEFERLKKLDIEKYIIGEPWIYKAK